MGCPASFMAGTTDPSPPRACHEDRPPCSLLSHHARRWRRPWWQSTAWAPWWPGTAVEAGDAVLAEEGLDTMPAHHGTRGTHGDLRRPQHHSRLTDGVRGRSGPALTMAEPWGWRARPPPATVVTVGMSPTPVDVASNARPAPQRCARAGMPQTPVGPVPKHPVGSRRCSTLPLTKAQSPSSTKPHHLDLEVTAFTRSAPVILCGTAVWLTAQPWGSTIPAGTAPYPEELPQPNWAGLALEALSPPQPSDMFYHLA